MKYLGLLLFLLLLVLLLFFVIFCYSLGFITLLLLLGLLQHSLTTNLKKYLHNSTNEKLPQTKTAYRL